MPMLKREPFVRSKTPDNLNPDDEVYHCRITNEIFTDYEKLFERVILCNSLVWTCSLTGKTGLTYQDACTSEETANQLMTTFPEALKKPFLFLITLTHRRILNDLVDDILNHVKDRYFIGETVEAYTEAGNVKKTYKVLKVMWVKDNGRKSVDNKASSSSSSSIICVDDDSNNSHSKQLKSSSKKSPTKIASPAKDSPSKAAKAANPADSYEYAVQEISGQIPFVRILLGSKLSRKKGLFTREKCKLFIRLNCEVNAQENIWKVKESALTIYKLHNVGYESLSPGPSPIFGVPETRKTENGKENIIDLTSEEKSKIKKALSKEKNDSQRLQDAQKAMQKVEEDLRKMREVAEEKKRKKLEQKMEQKKKQEMERVKKIEEKKKEKEDKKLINAKIIESNVPKEDLDCDSLKDLPSSTPVNCQNLSPELFGDLVYISEFIPLLNSLLDLDVPDNFDLDNLLKAVTSNVADGDYGNVLVSLVSTLFSNSREPDRRSLEDARVDVEDGDEFTIKACRQSLSTYGNLLSDLQLDVYSVSEVLRIYLSSLPADHLTNGNTSKHENHSSLKSFVEELNYKSVFELPPESKLQILIILSHQLLMCDVIRNYIEENFDKLKVAQKKLKMHQIACGKRAKDEAQYWAKKKQEQRLKSLLTGESKMPAEEKLKDETDQSNMRKATRAAQNIPDESFENLPSENINWEKISDGEKQQMKMWEKRKEDQFVHEVSQLLIGCPVAIGYDRTHRHYWRFTYLPGIFVEDYEDNVSGFKVSSPVKHKILSPLKKKKEEAKTEEGGKSNKENVPSEQQQLDAAASTKCPTMSVQDQIMTKGATRWSFYHRVEQIDLLMSNLNPRGIRECLLLSNLKENYNGIAAALKKTDVLKIFSSISTLSPSEVTSTKPSQKLTQSPSALSNSDVEVNGHKEGNAEDDIKNYFVESIHDLEERIFVGALGRFKNMDRDKWRKALVTGNYDFIISNLPLVDQQTQSRKGTPKEKSKSIGGLASALLQVERMVESRFIDTFLGQKDKKSKSKQIKKKENDVLESDDECSSTSSNASKSGPVEKWESNVKSATNVSQLFLFMSILESSVTWSKSALNARCCICRRKSDGENMLLCDGCDKGHHIYCLKPTVKTIPKGDWFCIKCRQKRPENKVKKPDEKMGENDSETRDYNDYDRKSNSDDSDDEGDVKKVKQELINKRFYGQKKLPVSISCSSLPSNFPDKKGPSLKGRATRNSNQRKYIEDDDDDDDDNDSIPEKKRKVVNGKNNSINYSLIPLKSCEKLVSELMSDENAWPFLRPVSKKDAADYLDIIKNPMDFSLIRNKIRSFQYDATEDMIEDIRLIFSNCKTYNQQSSCFYTASEKLSQVFEDRLEELATTSTHYPLFQSKESRKNSLNSEIGTRRKKVHPRSDDESDDEAPVRKLRRRH